MKRVKSISENKKRQYPSWDEVVKIMYDKGLHCTENCEVVKVIYSADSTKRFVILKFGNNCLTYSLEILWAYSKEELSYFEEDALPGYWLPQDNAFKSVFNDMDILMNELKTTSEYKTFFESI